jgi:hypothetical protein
MIDYDRTLNALRLLAISKKRTAGKNVLDSFVSADFCERSTQFQKEVVAAVALMICFQGF